MIYENEYIGYNKIKKKLLTLLLSRNIATLKKAKTKKSWNDLPMLITIGIGGT